MNWRNIDRLKIFLLGSILFLAISIREFIHFFYRRRGLGIFNIAPIVCENTVFVDCVDDYSIWIDLYFKRRHN